MAYQPKSYRKFVAGTVTAAVVASAVAPVASAATPSFSDVPANHQFAEAINSLAADGTFIGKDGKFDMYGELTRRQAAVVFSRLIEGEGKLEQVFSDVALTDAELTKAAYEVNAAGVMTGANGKLMPYSKLTRQQMAKIIVEHFDLKHVDGASVELKDLDKADPSLREYIQILAENGITVVADGNFRPTETVKRGQFAAFVYRAQQQGNIEELAITGAEVLSADGRYLEVQFNAPVGSVDKSQFEIREAGSSKRVGIEAAKASGKNVELVAYDAEEDDEIKEGKEYTVTYTANGKTLSFNFERPNYLDDREDDARVTEVDADNKDFTVSTKGGGGVTIEVPEGVEFDYEAAIGMEVRVWYTGDDKLIKYELVNADKAFYDAFEVTETADVNEGVGEIELQTSGKKYDLATNSSDDLDFKFFLNGTEVKTDGGKEAALTQDADFDYAKVILDDKGDVAYIYAYDLEEVIVVDKLDDSVVKGLGDEELDLEDFVIVKDGKTIKASDLQAGDAVYYNETANNSLGEKGYAVVYNNKVTGNVETIYDDSFKVAGKKYDYDTIEFVDNDEINDAFTKADAEDFEGSEVTLYVDFKGDARFLTGTQGEGNTNKVDAILTDAGNVYPDVKGELAVELEYVTAKGEEDAEDVYFEDLDTITVNGEDYDIEQDADENQDYLVKRVSADTFQIVVNDAADTTVKETVKLTDNTPIKLTLDEDGNITDLEVITGAQVKDLKEEIEPGDNYAEVVGGVEKKLNKDTLVFVADKGAATDAEDIEVYEFGSIDFDISAAGTKVYFDEDGDVQYIVTTDTNGSDTTEYAAVITGGVETDDNDVVTLKAFVEGVEKTYEVDQVRVDLANLEKGDVVRLEINDQSGVVEDIFEPADFAVDYLLANQTGATNLKSNKFTIAGTEYELVSGAKVYDASNPNDITVESVSDLKDQKFHVVLDSKNSNKVAAVVIIGKAATTADDTDYAVNASLANATAKVQAAENASATAVTTTTKANIDAAQTALTAAQTAVDALAAGANKTALQDRIDTAKDSVANDANFTFTVTQGATDQDVKIAFAGTDITDFSAGYTVAKTGEANGETIAINNTTGAVVATFNDSAAAGNETSTVTVTITNGFWGKSDTVTVTLVDGDDTATPAVANTVTVNND